MKIPRQSPTGTRAFTLIEILAIMVVALVLAAALVAGGGRVLAGSQQAKSIGNLRQLGSAALLFAAENNNALLPYRLDLGAGTEMWYHKLYPYTNWEKEKTGKFGAQPDIFYCPTTSKRYAINRICGWGNGADGLKSYLKLGQGVLPNSTSASWNGPPQIFELPGGLSKAAWFTTTNGGGAFASQTQRNATHEEYMIYPHNDQAAVLMMDGSVATIRDPKFSENPSIREQKQWIDFFGYFAY